MCEEKVSLLDIRHPLDRPCQRTIHDKRVCYNMLADRPPCFFFCSAIIAAIWCEYGITTVCFLDRSSSYCAIQCNTALRNTTWRLKYSPCVEMRCWFNSTVSPALSDWIALCWKEFQLFSPPRGPSSSPGSELDRRANYKSADLSAWQTNDGICDPLK